VPKGIKVASLTMWAAQLVFGLVSIIRNKEKNTIFTYVSAFGTGASFFLYITCVYMDYIIQTRDRENMCEKNTQIQNLQTEVTELSNNLNCLRTTVEGLSNKISCSVSQ
jgi:peptidoglycan hydrolase CwlO-like protein